MATSQYQQFQRMQQQGQSQQGQMPQFPQSQSPGALPPTGLQQQLGSLQQFYQGAQQGGVSAQGMTQQQGLPGGGVGPQGGPSGNVQPGQVNIQQLAKQLAQRYGLPLGRGELVDPSGNFLMLPNQLASASGGAETMGTAAAKMNYISQAIAAEQNRQQQRQGRAALSTGLGLVQSRAPGSLAAMQSGFYEGLADMYANEEYEAADFSYFIEQERLNVSQALERKREKRAKKGGMLGGIGALVGGIGGAIFGGVPGASIGSQIGGAAGQGIGSWF